MMQELQYETQFEVGGPRGLLSLFNAAHRYMQSGDCEQFIYIDPATGKPPLITTVDSTYTYSAPTDCRKIFAVCIDGINSTGGYWYYNFYNIQKNYTTNLEKLVFRNYWYYKIPLQTYSRNLNSVAQYKFPYNPGSTTNTIYYLFYYLLPREILSDSIDPDVPEQYHDLLMDGVLARVGKKTYGDMNPYDAWKQEVKVKYWKEMSSGEQTKTTFVGSVYN